MAVNPLEFLPMETAALRTPMGKRSAAERAQRAETSRDFPVGRIGQRINILEFSPASRLAPVRRPETGGKRRILRADSLAAAGLATMRADR